MQFIQDVEYSRFDEYVKNHPTKSHFMQSAAWGEFSRIQKGLIPHRTALLDDNGNIVAAALILERKPPLFPPYLYCPRGYVIDFEDTSLLKAFTKEVKKFAKSRKAMFLELDPDLERRAISENGSYLEGGFDNSCFVDTMKDMGYIHKGWNLGFEGREPRFTFRIDLTPEKKVIEKSFTGNVLKNIKKSRHYSLDISEGSSKDIPELFDMISRTSERDNFTPYNLSYYQNLYDCLAKDGMAHLYIGKVNPAKTVTLLQQELNEILEKREKLLNRPGPLNENMESEARLKREIELFSRYAEEYDGDVTVSTHFVVRYGKNSWAVHAGSRGIMNETFCNNRVYYEKLMAQKDAGCSMMDMFGTVGNPDENESFKSVHAFKKQWGGRYVEFIGQFDLITRPVWYFLYEKVRPAYQNMLWDLRDLKTKFKKK